MASETSIKCNKCGKPAPNSNFIPPLCTNCGDDLMGGLEPEEVQAIKAMKSES